MGHFCAIPSLRRVSQIKGTALGPPRLLYILLRGHRKKGDREDGKRVMERRMKRKQREERRERY